ncbi:hypothetical protein [Rhizorhabdus wittichii]|uniref:hypothetical protein n=1 Tax=Rhizorhabdus wittichii TaxID=160791 RepID=UPI0012FD6134|nr:hypothetical protein [Rhizorhabdus wittichii]
MPIITIAVLLADPACQPRPLLAGHAYRRINLKSLNRPRAARARTRARRTRAREEASKALVILLERKGFMTGGRWLPSFGRTRQKIAGARLRRTWPEEGRRLGGVVKAGKLQKIIDMNQALDGKITGKTERGEFSRLKPG